MRIHTNVLGGADLWDALQRAKRDGLVAQDVYFTQLVKHGSQSRARAYEVQLGTFDKTSGPTKSRHYKNSGTHGADTVYAATWDEWGWFLSQVFSWDSTAKCSSYNGRADFDLKTANAYRTSVHEAAEAYATATREGRYQGD